MSDIKLNPKDLRFIVVLGMPADFWALVSVPEGNLKRTMERDWTGVLEVYFQGKKYRVTLDDGKVTELLALD